MVFQPGDFERVQEWTMYTFKQLSGAMKQGHAKISLMEVEGRNVVGCETKYNKETYKVTDLFHYIFFHSDLWNSLEFFRGAQVILETIFLNKSEALM